MTAIDPPDGVPPPPRPEVQIPETMPRAVLPVIAPPQITPPEVRWVSPDVAPAPVIDAAVEAPPVSAPHAATADTALSYRATRSPDDYYPDVSLRLQEQGSAIVRVCVAADGRLEGVPRIERGSGSRHLDAAALKWAGEALVFTPATQQGRAVSACKGFRVNFTLR